MDNANSIVDRLKVKINRIIEYNNKLESDNSKLSAVNDKLQYTIRDQEKTIAELKDKLDRLMMSKSLTEVEGGVKSAKARVNRLLREIDKCISLLNR